MPPILTRAFAACRLPRAASTNTSSWLPFIRRAPPASHKARTRATTPRESGPLSTKSPKKMTVVREQGRLAPSAEIKSSIASEEVEPSMNVAHGVDALTGRQAAFPIRQASTFEENHSLIVARVNARHHDERRYQGQAHTGFGAPGLASDGG